MPVSVGSAGQSPLFHGRMYRDADETPDRQQGAGRTGKAADRSVAGQADIAVGGAFDLRVDARIDGADDDVDAVAEARWSSMQQLEELVAVARSPWATGRAAGGTEARRWEPRRRPGGR